jgi:hypothetical protein
MARCHGTFGCGQGKNKRGSSGCRLSYGGPRLGKGARNSIEEFRQITDPPAKAELAKELGYIGTEKTLSALADDMRSDIIWDRPGVMMQSIRVFIVGAFHYNYPENPLFFDIAVQSDEDYASIEKFCEETFGTKWTKDRPEFLWIEGYEFEDED